MRRIGGAVILLSAILALVSCREELVKSGSGLRVVEYGDGGFPRFVGGYSPWNGDEFLWGFIDHAGATVVAPRFQIAFPFSEGMAVVMVNDKFGAISADGDLVIEPRFAEMSSFSEGLSAVQDLTSGLIGFIDQRGKYIIPPSYAFGSWFRDGVAAVRVDKSSPWVLIDRMNRRLAKSERTGNLGAFSEGLAGYSGAYSETPRCGFLNLELQIAIDLRFRDWEPFSEGLAVVRDCDSGRAFFIDHSGSRAFPGDYAEAGSFRCGLAPVLQGRADTPIWGYIDHSGRLAIEPRFKKCGCFSEGLAPAMEGDTWGYIGPTGDFAIPSRYALAWSFSEGLAPVAFKLGNLHAADK